MKRKRRVKGKRNSRDHTVEDTTKTLLIVSLLPAATRAAEARP